MPFRFSPALYQQLIHVIHHARLLYHVLIKIETDYGIKDHHLSINVKDIISDLNRTAKYLRNK